jgi:hypothetical protein
MRSLRPTGEKRKWGLASCRHSLAKNKAKKNEKHGERSSLNGFLDLNLLISSLFLSLPLSSKTPVTKIKVANPVVDLDGDEMTR